LALKTELLDVTSESGVTRQAGVARIAHLLQSGNLVAFPTDTVYGIAAVANQPVAVAKLYAAKGRSPEKAIPILLASSDDLELIVIEVNDLVHQLIAHFWPGALTLVLPKSQTVPPEVSPTLNVAVRLPDHALTRQIIAAVGFPLAVTSANRSGQPSPCTAGNVLSQLGGRVAAILDGGACPGGIPSTILDCTADPPRLLRAGAIPVAELLQFTAVV
jgi:L-threonylcarbamoyladenylate synthase